MSAGCEMQLGGSPTIRCPVPDDVANFGDEGAAIGPGFEPAISVAITIGANHPDSVRSLLITGPAILIGVILVAATVFVAYRYAERLSRIIGETGMTVFLRLSAFILLCIGVQIVWNGASALLRTLPG